jgi:hypothetical protein
MDDFMRQIREFELDIEASNRDFYLNQVRRWRRSMILSRVIIIFYLAFAAWYLFRTVFEAWWYVFFFLIWLGLTFLFYRTYGREKRQMTEAQEKADKSRAKIVAMEKEMEE